MSSTSPRVTPFLMFEGRAEEAMDFYVGLFAGSAVESITRYGPGESGPEGSVQLAAFLVGGQRVMCIDSPAPHAFTFTPATSLYVTCESEAEIDRYYRALSADGAVLMPLDAYPFSPRFSWVQDRFGVSWQLTLANG